MPRDVRAVGHDLLGDHDWHVGVLDLVYDSVVDDPAGLVNDVRTLRFARGDRAAELSVRGRVYLFVDITVAPDDGAAVSVLARDHSGRGTVTWSCPRELGWLPAGLTSFLFEWPSDTGRRPVRTAWVLL